MPRGNIFGKHAAMCGDLYTGYSGPSILQPLMVPRRCGLILQVVLK